MSASMDTAVAVNSVREEYEYIGNQKCECGSAFQRRSQALIFDGDKKPFDKISVTCGGCGKSREFWFDCSSFFGKPFWE